MLARRTMPLDGKLFFLGLIPGIHAPLIMQPRLHFHAVVGQHRERRHAILTVILELVVAPNDAKVGLEFIQGAPRHAKTLDHLLAVRIGMRPAIVRAPLAAHRLRPILQRAQMLRQRRVGQTDVNSAAKVSLCHQAGIMSHAKSKYLSHEILP
jgi:hypothetical protein